MISQILKARECEAFVVKEVTAGTLVFPAATDLVGCVGIPTINQKPTYTNSEEIFNSRSLITRFQDQVGAGSWSLPMYVRPSGTAGSVPQGDAIFEALTGTKTVVPGTSITYAPAMELPSLSIWIRIGKTVFFAWGASANQGNFDFANKGGLKFDTSGNFMSFGWVGTDQLSADELLGQTEISIDNAKLFCVNGRVQFRTGSTIYNNSNAGYTVTAVNTTTNIITISPGLEVGLSTDDYVEPFLPSGTLIGSPLENRGMTISFDNGTSTAKIKGGNFQIVNNIKYLEEEISSETYPTEFIPDNRDVSGKVDLFMRSNDLQYFYDGYNNASSDVLITAGSVAGSRIKINANTVKLSVPEVSGSAPTINIAMDMVALATSAGEDECSIVFD